MKDTAVEVMSETVEQFNRQMAAQQNMDPAEIEKIINEQSYQLRYMNGIIYDALKDNGYINEYPLGRLWRDAKLYEIGAGTSEIRRMLIGRELFAETL